MSNETTFSAAQEKELQQALVEHLKTQQSIKDTFCKCWPCAKDVLQIILKIPKLPAIVAAVVGAIIKAGDLAQASLCKP